MSETLPTTAFVKGYPVHTFTKTANGYQCLMPFQTPYYRDDLVPIPLNRVENSLYYNDGINQSFVAEIKNVKE